MKLRINKSGFILCPNCGNKTRTKVRSDTKLKNFPLFCPKCKCEFLINVEKENLIIEPDTKIQSQ